MTYLLVDGENVDSTLGTILRNQPSPQDRPRWDRVITFVKEKFEDEEVEAFFFINVKNGAKIPYKFVHVLDMMGYMPILLEGTHTQVVDEGIKKTLEELVEREGNIVLVTHDNGYAELLNKAITAHNRNLAILGFEEFVSSKYSQDLPLTIYDLEKDVQAFLNPLQRGQVMELDKFDPRSLFENKSKE